MTHILIWVMYAIVMLFELRILIQQSNSDYYHPFVQTITKFTDPVNKLPGINSMRMAGLPIGGLLVAFGITLVFWILMFTGHIGLAVIISIMTVIKCFGYLVISLMIAQALTSWLPSTQSWSILFGSMTSPITNPVRRIIPPIGMIDISLMVVMLLIWLLNALIAKILFSISITLGQMWTFL